MRRIKELGTWDLVLRPADSNIVGCKWVQVPGVDYVDTFAPVAKFSTLRTLLALAASHDETIYMKQPPNFIDAEKPTHVCRLARGLYGLRQSGRVWYQTLASAFKDLGFDVCAVDHAVFVSRGADGKVIVAASTDDLLMISERMERLGEVHWLLGVEIRRDREKRTLSLSQGAYVQTILGRFNLENANSVTSPMDPGAHLIASLSAR